jgi:flagellar motor protein MotB
MESKKFYEKTWFLWVMLIFIAPVGIFLLWKYKRFNQPVRIVLTVIFALFFIGAVASNNDDNTSTTSTNTGTKQEATAEPTKQTKATISEEELKKQEEERQKQEELKKQQEEEEKKKAEELKKKQEEEEKLKQQLTFTGTLKMSVNEADKKVIIDIDTNVPDGGLFEVTIMNGEFKVLSEFVPAKDQKVTKEFVIPKDWGIGYISSLVMFRFNLDDHPQPDSIKAIYGDKGEKMLGTQTQDTTVGGKNGTIEAVTIAYPSEEAVKAEQAKQFKNVLTELIKTSDGVITSIKPRFDDGDWGAILVTVSDSWYYSAEHEKERFCEQIQQLLETTVKNTGIVKKDSAVTVFFYDTYGKELASPKMFGGYKILR